MKGNYIYFDLNEEVRGEEGHRHVEVFVKNNLDLLVGKNNFFCLERNNNKIVCRQKL